MPNYTDEEKKKLQEAYEKGIDFLNPEEYISPSKLQKSLFGSSNLDISSDNKKQMQTILLAVMLGTNKLTLDKIILMTPADKKKVGEQVINLLEYGTPFPSVNNGQELLKTRMDLANVRSLHAYVQKEYGNILQNAMENLKNEEGLTFPTDENEPKKDKFFFCCNMAETINNEIDRRNRELGDYMTATDKAQGNKYFYNTNENEPDLFYKGLDKDQVPGRLNSDYQQSRSAMQFMSTWSKYVKNMDQATEDQKEVLKKTAKDGIIKIAGGNTPKVMANKMLYNRAYLLNEQMSLVPDTMDNTLKKAYTDHCNDLQIAFDTLKRTGNKLASTSAVADEKFADKFDPTLLDPGELNKVERAFEDTFYSIMQKEMVFARGNTLMPQLYEHFKIDGKDPLDLAMKHFPRSFNDLNIREKEEAIKYANAYILHAFVTKERGLTYTPYVPKYNTANSNQKFEPEAQEGFQPVIFELDQEANTRALRGRNIPDSKKTQRFDPKDIFNDHIYEKMPVPERLKKIENIVYMYGDWRINLLNKLKTISDSMNEVVANKQNMTTLGGKEYTDLYDSLIAAHKKINDRASSFDDVQKTLHDLKKPVQDFINAHPEGEKPEYPNVIRKGLENANTLTSLLDNQLISFGILRSKMLEVDLKDKDGKALKDQNNSKSFYSTLKEIKKEYGFTENLAVKKEFEKELGDIRNQSANLNSFFQLIKDKTGREVDILGLAKGPDHFLKPVENPSVETNAMDYVIKDYLTMAFHPDTLKTKDSIKYLSEEFTSHHAQEANLIATEDGFAETCKQYPDKIYTAWNHMGSMDTQIKRAQLKTETLSSVLMEEAPLHEGTDNINKWKNDLLEKTGQFRTLLDRLDSMQKDGENNPSYNTMHDALQACANLNSLCTPEDIQTALTDAKEACMAYKRAHGFRGWRHELGKMRIDVSLDGASLAAQELEKVTNFIHNHDDIKTTTFDELLEEKEKTIKAFDNKKNAIKVNLTHLMEKENLHAGYPDHKRPKHEAEGKHTVPVRKK